MVKMINFMLCTVYQNNKKNIKEEIRGLLQGHWRRGLCRKCWWHLPDPLYWAGVPNSEPLWGQLLKAHSCSFSGTFFLADRSYLEGYAPPHLHVDSQWPMTEWQTRDTQGHMPQGGPNSHSRPMVSGWGWSPATSISLLNFIPLSCLLHSSPKCSPNKQCSHEPLSDTLHAEQCFPNFFAITAPPRSLYTHSFPNPPMMFSYCRYSAHLFMYYMCICAFYMKRLRTFSSNPSYPLGGATAHWAGRF